MPLLKSGSKAAISTNISEMVHSGHPQRQAVAAALSNARRYGRKYAAGGYSGPFEEHFAARQAFHEGFLHSAVPGRTDKLPISVSGGAYVLPADHVAALGQGNSLAGANIVNKMFKMGPYGTQLGGLHAAGKAPGAHLNLTPHPGKMPKLSDEGGGRGSVGRPTDIIAAGGEIVIPPEKITAKFGDLKHGHKALDQWVLNTRQKHIKTLKKLKPPKVN
jgi:hypothetical protein